MRFSKHILLVLALILVGCDSGGANEEEPSYTGNYQLQTVDGQNTPAILAQSGNDTVELTSGYFRINEGQTFETGLSLRVTESGQVSTASESFSGTYSNNNNAFSFSYSNGGSDTGSISGDELTLISDGVTLVFEK